MQSIQQDMENFSRQLQRGSIQRAYRALLDYMMDLRTQLKPRFPGCAISGLYQGYLDMTYFAIVPPSLKQRDLKIAIVFNYPDFRFEAWLAAANRQVQRRTWELFKDSRWAVYRVVEPAAGVDAILECILAQEVDFSDLDRLSATIAQKTAAFSADVERYLDSLAGRVEIKIE